MSDHKLTEEQFLGALEQANGIFGDTPAIILEAYGITLTRQAVRQRALLFPDLLKQMRLDSVIDAEDTVRDIMKNGADGLKLKAGEYLLDRLGKSVGYTPKQEIDNHLDLIGAGGVIILPDNGRDTISNDTDTHGSGDSPEDAGDQAAAEAE